MIWLAVAGWCALSVPVGLLVAGGVKLADKKDVESLESAVQCWLEPVE